MRTIKVSAIAALAATAFAACTIKDVDTPAFSGPSSMARTIIMTADRDTLLQDGVSEAAIRITAQVQPGQSENVRLRAQVFVDGVAQDFGTLSNKNPITPTTIFFRAPAPPTAAGGQVPTLVTIRVTPEDQGDFRSEVSRELDLMVIPPGVILPTNPTLVANFTFSPAQPKVGDIITFNASTSTNRGTSCGQACSYAWNFGDGTTGTGLFPSHQYRRVATYQVTLTITDSRGATASTIQAVAVAEPAEPTVEFDFSPTDPAPGQIVFFNASASKAAPGRTIVSYDWNFGDGTFGTGELESHVFHAPGTYKVTLRVTDDVGAFKQTTKDVTVAAPTP